MPVPAHTTLHDHVLRVDGADTVAVKLFVVLVHDGVGLAGVVMAAREVPEAAAVEVDVARIYHALM